MPSAETNGAIFKVLGPLVAIGVVFLVLRVRKFPPREFLALKRPPTVPAIAWLAGYVAFMLGSNALMDWRGPWDFTQWRAEPLAVSVMRVLAVCVLGPIAEELVFRGLLFAVLRRLRVPPLAIVAITAAVWAGIHVNYDLPVIALLFVSGLILGAARWKTDSIFPPLVMHITWNLFAVW